MPTDLPSANLQRDFPLASSNTFGLVARARWFARVESIAQLQALRERPEWRDGPRLILGGGSNIVFTRDFDGLVVHVATRGHRHLGDDGDDHLVEVEAGESWDGFVHASLAAGWPGLENLAAIPGSVGAAPVQNVGAYGVELVERFAWLDAMDVDTGAVVRMNPAACGFGYRDSVFKRALRGRVVITKVVFRLPLRWEPRIDYGDVRSRVTRPAPSALDVADAVAAIRREKLPDWRTLGNAGSFFKNPVIPAATFDALREHDPGIVGYRQPDGRIKVAAAWLIDRCGWRGRALSDDARAAVHDRQALVLVNRGGATGADVVALATAIRHDVMERFGIDLEPEPLIV